MLSFLSLLDLTALAVFAACWAGYALVVDRVPAVRARSVLVAMDAHRLRWLRSATGRDNRIPDVAVVGNLMASTSFLANTAIFILGGLLALLASPEVGRRVLAAMPWGGSDLSDGAWEARILLLLFIFIRAFFELTWALRQFNYGSILIGGMPKDEAAATAPTKVVNRAARHFNTGLRAYYFGLAALTWIVHPVALMLTSAVVVAELARREFRSHVLDALTGP